MQVPSFLFGYGSGKLERAPEASKALRIDKVLTLGVAPRLLELSQQMLGLLSGHVEPRKTVPNLKKTPTP